MDIDRLALCSKIIFDRRILEQRHDIERLNRDVVKQFFLCHIRASHQISFEFGNVSADVFTFTGNEIVSDQPFPLVLTPRVIREDMKGKVLVTAQLVRWNDGVGTTVEPGDERDRILATVGCAGWEMLSITPQVVRAIEHRVGRCMDTDFVGWIFEKQDVEGILRVHDAFASVSKTVSAWPMSGPNGTPLHMLIQDDHKYWRSKVDVYDINNI